MPCGITSAIAVTRETVTRAHVGTSGFSYPSWRPGFYPAAARPRDFLRLYAERLSSVELNTSFYQLPAEEQFARWAAETPPAFRFSVKMSRRITHAGGLDQLGTFCERVQALGDRLGPVLVQFPPARQRDDGLLRFFLDSIDPALRYAFEFREDSWTAPEIDLALDAAGVARVGSLAGAAGFRYLRLREPPYDQAALAAWAGRLRRQLEQGIEVWCYFKHEDEPTAPLYAERLRDLLAA
ncbi:MAG: DUF72 domain-containing protein [Gaiellaceae bacterium]